MSPMPFDPAFVAPNPLLQPLAGEISALIGIGSHAMRLKTHPLPQMNGAVGTKLSALLLNAHMSGRCPSDKLLDGLLDALPDITA